MWLGICRAKTNWFNLLPCVPSRNLWFPVDSSCINHDYGDNKDDDSDNMEMVIKKMMTMIMMVMLIMIMMLRVMMIMTTTIATVMIMKTMMMVIIQ